MRRQEASVLGARRAFAWWADPNPRPGWYNMRLVDAALAVPRLFLLLIVLAVPDRVPLAALILLIGTTGWFTTSRLVRAEALRLRQESFVEAARALGATDPLILVRHILPHLLSPVIVAFSLDVGAKILATAGLSFLGLGTQPPTADWGSMLSTGRQFVVLSPHVVLLPGLAIFAVVLALNLVGDALRDLLDPRFKP